MKKSKLLKSNKTLIIIAVVTIVLAIVGFVLIENNFKDGFKTGTTTKNAPVISLTDEQQQKLQAEYTEQQNALNELDSLGDDQKKSLYTGMAFKGATLRDPKSKEYAEKALGMMSEEELNQANENEVIKALKQIQSGDIEAAYAAAVPFTSE